MVMADEPGDNNNRSDYFTQLPEMSQNVCVINRSLFAIHYLTK